MHSSSPENPQQEEESFRRCGTTNTLQLKQNSLEGFVAVDEASKHSDHAIKGEGVVKAIMALGRPEKKGERNQIRGAPE